MSVLTWNIEGIRRHKFFLAEILEQQSISLAFLSEPQAYQCDISNAAQYIRHDYCYALNSDDLYDPELPLTVNKAKGGTMVVWRRSLDPYIKVVEVSSSAFLPILLTIPGYCPSVHVALYLPTHGQDSEFVSELTNLKNCLDSLIITYSNLCVYLRGDGNVNSKNSNRVKILDSFKEQYSLVNTIIEHKTYHHFVGAGQFDSNIDIILHSDSKPGRQVVPEVVKDILCQDNYPAISSHHDIILSTLTLTPGTEDTHSSNPISAPRLNHQRHQIIWSEDGIQDYSTTVAAQLKRIRHTWLNPHCQASMSILLDLTNKVMSKAAMDTNKFRILRGKTVQRKKRIPKNVKKAKQRMNKIHRRLKETNSFALRDKFKLSRKMYHQVVRSHNLKTDMERDIMLFNIIGESPGKVFRHIKAMKKSGNSLVAKLTVGQAVYTGEAVADGFFESMSSLKRCDSKSLESVPELSEKLLDYNTVIELCRNHNGIPSIDSKKAKDLLYRIKRGVKDHYSITVEHYIHAGHEGLQHFNLLLNGIISDLNNASLEELNMAHGLIYYKGHKKDKESERSYRNISSCPFMAKALDMYIRDLCIDLWQDQQASTQYQGPGSSHELASVLLTEVIQHSLFVARKPLYLLALDAQSAFDRCLRQVLTSELFKAGVPPAAILVIDKRLASRTTVYEWEGQMMGPASDVTGFEQGGVNSSDYYKLYNNEQLRSAQNSKLGVDIGSDVVSAVGQADDVILAAPSLHHLQLLVYLTEQYCRKFRVKLESTKTKLLAYHPKGQSLLVDLAMNTRTIKINGTPVQRVKEADHVGVLRSTGGNLPHIVNRLAAHKKALYALLPAGLASRHRGNPLASLKINQLYCLPVLVSGLASLVLTKAELKIIDDHYLKTLQSLLRLHRRTPRSIVYYLAGSLPAQALLHQKQMTLFSMICHLKEDPLQHHAEYAMLHYGRSSRSWFIQLKDICIQYGLPHPLELLSHPISKEKLKVMVKNRISQYWHQQLCSEASSLSSLTHFSPHMHLLSSPHPLWVAAGSSPYEINKSTVLCRMVSGRYVTENMSRFWTENQDGLCLIPACYYQKTVGDLAHLLLHCPALHTVRENLYHMWLARASAIPPLYTFVTKMLASAPHVRLKFILDPTSMPEIINLYQNLGTDILNTVFYMTRTYAYCIHRKKQILIGRWPYATRNPDSRNIPSNRPVSGTVGYQDEPLDVLPDVQGVHELPEAVPSSDGQYHSMHSNTMHPHPQPIGYVNARGSNVSEHGHKLVEQLQQQGLSLGLGLMVGLSDGTDSYGCAMQHSNLTHHYTSQSGAPAAGSGWVAQGVPVALWSTTASLLHSYPQAAYALQTDRSLELV